MHTVFLSDFDDKGSVYLIGDFDSRTGRKADYVIFDTVHNVNDHDDYIPGVPLCRASLDKVCNSHGTKLLNICKSTRLRHF